MSKQLIMITAPFNCGFCKRAQQELPEICKNDGWELVEMQNEKGSEDNLPVESYPTFMVRINEEIKDTIRGYNKDKILTELKKY
jgi:predicted HicB family RNase H-like nuclease